MAEEYLANREELVLFIQLVDSRHKPSEQDLDLSEWLTFHGKNAIVVATKSDKLSKNELAKNIREIERTIADKKIVAYSANTGLGRDAVWSEIERSLAEFEKRI